MSVTDTAPGRPLVTGHRLVIVGLLAVAAALFFGHDGYQTAEIELAGLVVQLVSGHGVYVDGHLGALYFGLGGPDPLGLRMTPECTSAFLVLPLLLIGAVLIALRPNVTRRVLFAIAVASAALIVVNQLRILNLVMLVSWLGTDRGYYWGHTLLGSLVSIIGGAAALTLFVWLATRHGKRGKAEAK